MAAFRLAVNRKYNDDSICDSRNNFCHWPTDCYNVDKTKGLDLLFKFQDRNGIHDIVIPQEKLFVPAGDITIGYSDDHCYLPVFDSGMRGLDESKLAIVGSIFLQEYYTVFDASHLEKENYLQIGFAKKAEDNWAGEQHYNVDSPKMDPEDVKMDASHIEPEH